MSAFASAADDYFPLQVGNTWVYRGSGTRANTPLTIEVTGTTEHGGVTYYVVRGLQDREVHLRADQNGGLFVYDAAASQERRWWDFAAKEGEAYESTVSCCGRAMVASRAADYKGDIGTFNYALEMRYPGVFQVGIDRDLFLPYVGLVSRSIATGGPTYGGYDLTYARVGGVLVVSGPEIAFTLALDKTVYKPGDSVDIVARLSLKNSGSEPVELTFSSGQLYDLTIRNDRGEQVYTWSADKLFPQVLQTIRVSGEKTWAFKANPKLAAGSYTAEGYLATNPRVFSATVKFEVR
jgi:hypothetical protein